MHFENFTFCECTLDEPPKPLFEVKKNIDQALNLDEAQIDIAIENMQSN